MLEYSHLGYCAPYHTLLKVSTHQKDYEEGGRKALEREHEGLDVHGTLTALGQLGLMASLCYLSTLQAHRVPNLDYISVFG